MYVCVVFKADNYEGGMYTRSPYFVGTKLWNALSAADVDLPDIYTFRFRLKWLNHIYI